MLKELIEKNRTQYREYFSSWEEAIAESCMPLLEDGSITEEYIMEMIESVNKFGPYIVLAPNIAMPHSMQGANGVNKTAVCFTKVNNAVSFEVGNPDKDARLFFVLASVDADEHLANMMKLADLLSQEGLIDDLLTVNNDHELLAIHEKYFPV